MVQTKQEIEMFVSKARNTNEIARQLCIDLLSDDNLFPSHEILFNWEDGDAACIVSGQFDDDITDAYITRLYVKDNTLYADLHAYYLGEDCADVDLGDECSADYVDILESINYHID